ILSIESTPDKLDITQSDKIKSIGGRFKEARARLPSTASKMSTEGMRSRSCFLIMSRIKDASSTTRIRMAIGISQIRKVRLNELGVLCLVSGYLFDVN